MTLSSLRERFSRVKTHIYDTGECQMHVHHDPRELHIDIAICHEVQVLDAYRVRHLADSGFRPQIVVDIGAHIGTFTALAAKYFPEAAIYSFEPLKQHYRVLALNSPPRRGHATNLAVLGFYRQEEGRDLYPGNEFEHAFRTRQLSNAISVERLFRKFKLPRIDFLKIDCEQSEVNIFRELDALDRLKDIEVIAGEWHFDTAKNELRSIVAKTHEVDLVDEGMWNHFFARRKRS